MNYVSNVALLKVQESLDEKPSCLSRQATKEAMRSKGSVWDQNAWWVASTQTNLTSNIRVPVVVNPGLIFHAQISQKHIQTPALYIKCKKPSCLRWLWSVSTWLSLSWKECSHWIISSGWVPEKKNTKTLWKPPIHSFVDISKPKSCILGQFMESTNSIELRHHWCTRSHPQGRPLLHWSNTAACPTWSRLKSQLQRKAR